jgi:CRISPR/Cas system CMR subunit Cmr4 (Cas7 group RAMP superfamily)
MTANDETQPQPPTVPVERTTRIPILRDAGTEMRGGCWLQRAWLDGVINQ